MIIMAQTQFLHHEFGPLYREDAKALILGSFPSVKSREVQFYYGHPQNRFWRIMRALCDPAVYSAAMAGEPVALPASIKEKKALVLGMHLALWDTIESCEITGSSDSSIRQVKVNDFSCILKDCHIQTIFCNGSASYKLFMRYAAEGVTAYCEENSIAVPAFVQLPSTSPANAAWSLPRLLEKWRQVTL